MEMEYTGTFSLLQLLQNPREDNTMFQSDYTNFSIICGCRLLVTQKKLSDQISSSQKIKLRIE